MGDVLTRAIGWYGKLPWVGDFVGHGLPWQRTWDNWLQRSLPAAEVQWGHAALRQRDGLGVVRSDLISATK